MNATSQHAINTYMSPAILAAAISRAIVKWTEDQSYESSVQIKDAWPVSYGIAFSVEMNLVSPSGVTEEGVRTMMDMIEVEGITVE